MWDVANLDVVRLPSGVKNSFGGAELFLCPALQITTVPLEDTNDLTCLSLQEDHDVVGKICSP